MAETELRSLRNDAPSIPRTALRRRAAPRSELHDGWLRVHFGRGTPAHADYHFRWLRSQPSDRAPRAAAPVDELGVIASYVDAERRLHVQWSERHAGRRVELSESIYPLDWLRERAYAAERSAVSPPSPDLARVEVDARRVGPRWALREFCVDRLLREGAVVVRGFGEDTESLIRLLEQREMRAIETPRGRIADLRSDAAGPHDPEQSNAAVPPHTDEPFAPVPPAYQVLHCLLPGTRGGESIVVDARQAAAHLRSVDAEAFRLLATVPVRHHDAGTTSEPDFEAPVVSVDPRGELAVRFGIAGMTPPHLPFERVDAWYCAHDRFARLVHDPRHQTRTRLEAGDFLLLDNRRMLHGRSAATGLRWVRQIHLAAADKEDES